MTEPRTERKKRYQNYQASMASGGSSTCEEKLPSIHAIEALKEKMMKAASQKVIIQPGKLAQSVVN